MTPTLGAGSVWDILELGGGLEPLESILAPNDEFLDCSLLPGQDLDLLSAEDAAAWLVGDLAAGDEAKLITGDPCEPAKLSASLPAVPAGAQPLGQPTVPAVRDGLAAMASSGEWDELAGAASPHSASSGASGQGPLLAPFSHALPDLAYGSLQQLQQPQRQQSAQEQSSMSGLRAASSGASGQGPLLAPFAQAFPDLAYESLPPPPPQQQQAQQQQQQQAQQQPILLGLRAVSSGASGQALPSSSGLLEPTYSTLWQQQGQQPPPQELVQEQQQPRKAAAPRQPRGRGRGRPRVDRSQMTQRQLKAIENAQAHLARKKNHMRDLEEQVADVRADLERERAQQEDGQRAIEALERLLSYRDEMIAVLREHGQEESALLAARAGTAALTCSGGSSSSSAIVSSNGSYGRPLRPANLYRLTMPSGSSSWVYKHPSTWAYVEHVRTVELPAMHAQWKAWQACAQNTFEQHMGCQWRPGQEQHAVPYRHRFLQGPDPLRALCATADAAVLAEVQNMDPRDIVEGWRDYARLSRDVLAEYDVTKNYSQAVAQVNPHMERLAVLINLATVHNPALLKQVYLASADNFSAEQRKEKYDALVREMEITPNQQEHYLELAEAYESFVRQARQYKEEALARIGQSGGFGSLTATSCSLGRMVSGYLDALEGAATLSAYVDAEFLAVVELTKGMAKIHNPLQKARSAAMAYPQFMDVINLMEAIKRLPPPEQRRRQLGEEASGASKGGPAAFNDGCSMTEGSGGQPCWARNIP